MQVTLKTPIEQAIADAACAETQPRELKRVRETIGRAILQWCKVHVGREIHLEDLQTHVLANHSNTNLSSVDRVFRDLRKRGVIDYTCVRRRGSLYRIEGVYEENLT